MHGLGLSSYCYCPFSVIVSEVRSLAFSGQSSDLVGLNYRIRPLICEFVVVSTGDLILVDESLDFRCSDRFGVWMPIISSAQVKRHEIGRASCRERV